MWASLTGIVNCPNCQKMMVYICYTTSMTSVKIAYAKAHLPAPLARVARGERIVISRYNTPMAELVPPPKVEKAPTQVRYRERAKRCSSIPGRLTR